MPAVPFTEWEADDFATLRDDLDRARRSRNWVGDQPQPGYVAALNREITALQQMQDEADAYDGRAA